MGFIQYLLGRIDISAMSDVSGVAKNPHGLFALLAIVIVVFYGLSVGKTKALVSLLAVYVAFMLTLMFPFMAWLEHTVPLSPDAPVLPALLFLVFYIATFAVLSGSMMKGRLTLGEISMVKVVLISIVQLGLISSITISLLPSEMSVRAFGPVYPFLAGQRTLWFWAVSSLLIMPFLKGRKRE